MSRDHGHNHLYFLELFDWSNTPYKCLCRPIALLKPDQYFAQRFQSACPITNATTSLLISCKRKKELRKNGSILRNVVHCGILLVRLQSQ